MKGDSSVPSSFFHFFNEPFWLAHHPKKANLFLKKLTESLEATQNFKNLCEDVVCPLWPTYIGEKGRTIWDKKSIVLLRITPLRNTLNLRNIIVNMWEHIKNIVGTPKKILKLHATTTTQGRKMSPHEYMFYILITNTTLKLN